jgi:hypothetical protein
MVRGRGLVCSILNKKNTAPWGGRGVVEERTNKFFYFLLLEV